MAHHGVLVCTIDDPTQLWKICNFEDEGGFKTYLELHVSIHGEDHRPWIHVFMPGTPEYDDFLTKNIDLVKCHWDHEIYVPTELQKFYPPRKLVNVGHINDSISLEA